MELAVQLSTDSDRVTTITMDLPGKPVNTFSPQLLERWMRLSPQLNTKIRPV